MLKQQATQRGVKKAEWVDFLGEVYLFRQENLADLSLKDAILKYFNEHSQCVNKNLLQE